MNANKCEFSALGARAYAAKFQIDSCEFASIRGEIRTKPSGSKQIPERKQKTPDRRTGRASSGSCGAVEAPLVVKGVSRAVCQGFGFFGRGGKTEPGGAPEDLSC